MPFLSYHRRIIFLYAEKGHEEYIIYGEEKIYSSDHNFVKQTIKIGLNER